MLYTQQRSVPLGGDLIISPVRRHSLGYCENGQMLYLSLCNYFDADDRDWLLVMWHDECAQCEPKHTHAGTRAGWMARLYAINPLDSFNKRPEE